MPTARLRGVVPSTVAILIPVLARPHRVAPLVESIRAASTVTPCRAVFLATEGDDAEIAAIRAVQEQDDTVALHTTRKDSNSWAKKINYGFTMTDEPFVFMGADDIHFHPGCIERMLACHLETGACVVGTNDGGHLGTMTGEHSTHTLVCREYGECGTIDEPDSGMVLHPAYAHWFPDQELFATAKYRGTYAHATDAIVEHFHPNWQKARMDNTYRLGQSFIAQDRALYESRKHLWS